MYIRESVLSDFFSSPFARKFFCAFHIYIFLPSHIPWTGHCNCNTGEEYTLQLRSLFFSIFPLSSLSRGPIFVIYFLQIYYLFFIFLFPHVLVQVPAQLSFMIDLLSFPGSTNISSYMRPIIYNCILKSIDVYSVYTASYVFRNNI
jgi:hypothetical protein